MKSFSFLAALIIAGHVFAQTSKPSSPPKMTPSQADEFVKALPESVRKGMVSGELYRRQELKFISRERDYLLAQPQDETTTKQLEDLRKRESLTRPANIFFPSPLNPPTEINCMGKIARALIVQVIDDTNEIVIVGDTRTETIWLSGFSTAGNFDNQLTGVNALVRIDGTKQYTNTLGAQKTVLLATKFDITPFWSLEVSQAIMRLTSKIQASNQK